MDDLDRKILALLAKNARMPVKEIAEKVALTSPAVSSRIHKLETDGIISGYTVMLNRPADRVYLTAYYIHPGWTAYTLRQSSRHSAEAVHFPVQF